MQELQSETVIVAAPMSFTGSAQRLWRMTDGDYNPWLFWLLIIPVTLLVIGCAWAIILTWYLIFGIFLVPYRLIRRSQRKEKKRALQHREMIAAVKAEQAQKATS